MKYLRFPPISGVGLFVAGPAAVIGALVLTVNSAALRFLLGGLLFAATVATGVILRRSLRARAVW